MLPVVTSAGYCAATAAPSGGPGRPGAGEAATFVSLRLKLLPWRVSQCSGVVLAGRE